METAAAANALRVVKEERDRRIATLSDDPEIAYDQWLFTEGPFINDLCLTVLVAVHHQLERQLLQIAARLTDDGRELEPHPFCQRLVAERNALRARGGRKKLIAKLDLKALPDWNTVETLRFLAISYKHNPDGEPDGKLLEHLRLDPSENYASLPESEAVITALAESLSLGERDLCAVAEELLTRTDSFLRSASDAQPNLSNVRWGPVSLDPRTFAR